MTPDEIRQFIVDHDVQVLPKRSSRLMRFIAWFCSVRWFWLFQINADFMDSYTTTMGKKILYPKSWGPFSLTDDAAIQRHATTFEHEFVHIRQFERWWHFFSIAYVLLPIPFGLAWFRWRFERVGYLTNIRNGRTIDHCVDALWRYGWPWPRSLMRRWFEKAVQQSDDPQY